MVNRKMKPDGRKFSFTKNKKEIRYVYCVMCRKKQVDKGRGKTCERCGGSPLPSYSFPETSVFHPERKRSMK